MRILSKRQLKELVLYSPQHIARLEKAGKFPKRVQLGPNCLSPLKLGHYFAANEESMPWPGSVILTKIS